MKLLVGVNVILVYIQLHAITSRVTREVDIHMYLKQAATGRRPIGHFRSFFRLLAKITRGPVAEWDAQALAAV